MATKKAAKKTSASKKSASSGTGAKKSTGSTSATKKGAASKRELIVPNADKRLIRRDEQGRISESDDLGKSLAQDVRKKSKTVVKSGQGDRGDQKKRTSRKSK